MTDKIPTMCGTGHGPARTCEVCGKKPAVTECHAHDCENACLSADSDGGRPTACCSECMGVDPVSCVWRCDLCLEHFDELRHEEAP